MVAWIISRLVVLIFGTLYPAYYSYKAVKSKDIKEYVKWMMYWIIFALFTTAETFTDIFLCWFPFYYELKIAFVAWLLSPYTKGSSLLYRKFVHPTLSSKEKEIDDCLVQAKDRSYDALVHFGKRGLNVAATAAVMAASKGQGALSERLRSFSMQDLSTIRGDGAPAPSGPPAPGPGRASGKHGQPKMSRSASESAGSSVCSCCSACRTRKVVEGDVNEGGVKAWEPHQVHNPLAFSDEEEEDLLDFMYKFKEPRKTEFPLEAPPRILRSRFRKKSTSSSATETTVMVHSLQPVSQYTRDVQNEERQYFSDRVSRALTGFPRERSLSSERPVLEKAKQNPTDPLKHT
ncbi:receptor expression-enhancing protein 1 isoform X4 [Sus scrofa]|uniref:Receptor expression-enhancing protein n=2 Tax=Sus scrofa TaxID=9823 RepID=A0A4X1W5M0_PIG|nr:receptor expression-enhancing protein 1 isoform X4 [Sus scrofa]